jgi:solute carrier family 25 folate transporter 32
LPPKKLQPQLNNFSPSTVQNNASQFGQSISLLRSIITTEGSSLALYRGLTPNLVGNSTSWALYFYFYAHTKDVVRALHEPGHHLSHIDYFGASSLAGCLTALLTNPIWVIKTRMLSSGRDTPGAYRGMWHGVRHIWETEGMKGFWRGLVPSLVGISHGAVQFAIYERLKERRLGQLREQGKVEQLGNGDYLLLSGASKIFAGASTYPYQVVRVRLQSYDAGKEYKGVGDVVIKVWKADGIRGFYKGLIPNLVRVLPSTCVTFLVYENTKLWLPDVYAGWKEKNA